MASWNLKRTDFLSAIALFASSLFSQTTPVFEVATITLASLMNLICIAYNVDRFQVSSSTPLDRQNFDVIASVPEGPTRQQFRVMLQSLLAEGFALKLHIDSKEFPAYELVVSKTGLKIREAIAGELPSASVAAEFAWHRRAGGPKNGYLLVGLKAQMETFSRLAGIRKTPDETRIVDKTGLTGVYSFTLEYTRDAGGTTPTDPPSAADLSTALQHQLGLQLVPKKLPFDVVAVESFNKLPTGN